MEEALDKIREFADEAHGEQMRKYTPERYIVHPVRVMETCRNYDAGLPILAAALLHDVLEDTPVGSHNLLAFLETVMGENEAGKTLRLVQELTDVYVKSAYPQWNRKTRKKKELERIATTSADAQTIKYADIIDNSTEIVLHDPGFAGRYLKESHDILRQADKGNSTLRKEALKTIENALRLLKNHV